MENHTSDYRVEKDSIGTKDVPANVYYGVQSLRAAENFPITGLRMNPELIRSLAYIKKAAALTNLEAGLLNERIANAIVRACDEILAGKLREQFIVDPVQGGAGTSINMNANEVIANRALELLGHKKGEYEYCHPNNHVNCSQSTNDIYPTALRIALYTMLGQLTGDMAYLQQGFAAKSEEFSDVIKMGRTQLQDAVPMTLGQEFGAYATTIGEDILRVEESRKLLLEVNLGATAIGTSINAPKGYAEVASKSLAEVSGIPVLLSTNLIEATWDTGAYVQTSGVLKRIAVKLSKICNDLRLLSSGPRTGINEINLPRLQPGSSIMPGKVNPVIPEVVSQVAFDIIGKDVTITLAAEAGQLELNVMEPIIAFTLFTGIRRLARAFSTLQERCVAGITANADRCRQLVENSIGIVTALNTRLGYETSASIAKEALESGRSVMDLVLEKQLLTREELDELLLPENMIHPFLK